MGLEKAAPDGSQEDRSPQPSLVDRDRLASLRNDLLKRGTFSNRISQPSRPPPPLPDDAPILQARVSIPDSAPDRQQWVKQQSSSRRRRRRSSKSPSPQEGRGRRASTRTGSENRPSSSSRSSSLGGGESDASSASVDSRRSTASTPEASSGRQRQLERHQQQHRRFGSSERTGSAAGPSSRGLTPSMLSSAGGAQTGGTLSRTSSSSSLSTAVSSSSLGSLSLRWCAVCEAEFTRLRRPHRCRRCLEAVCAPCSPARLPVPGSGSLELKRTCKLCAGRSARPQVDVVVSPRRPKAVVASPAGAQRRAASMGSSMIRAPLGVFSGVAAAVKYTAGLYPAASSSGAVNRGEDAGKGGSGGLDAGVGGGGGENGEASTRSSNDQAYFPTRIATGGLAALGRWRAGMSLSAEKPPEGPSASTPAAGAGGDEAKASVAGTDVATEPPSEAAEGMQTTSAPAVGAEVTEFKAPAPQEDAGVGAARPGIAGPSPVVGEQLSKAPAPAVGAEVAESKAVSSLDEASVGASRPHGALPSVRARGEPSAAPAPAVIAEVAEAKAPAASEEEAAETFAGVTTESPQALTPAVGDEVAEAKAPELDSEAEVGAVAEDAWTMVEGDVPTEAPIGGLAGRQTESHVGDALVEPAVAGEPESVSGGGMPWRTARQPAGSGRAASTAALEEKAAVRDARDAPRAAAAGENTSARCVPTTPVQAAQGSERATSGAVVGETTTSSPEEVVPSSPLRRALRFVRRLALPHVARLREWRDSPPHRSKESVADLLPVLKAGSPVALECCTAFGIDAAAWMQTARIASESYRVVEERAKRRLARRNARR